MLVIKNLPSCPWREQTLLSWLSHSDFSKVMAYPLLSLACAACWDLCSQLRVGQPPLQATATRGKSKICWVCEVVREAKQEAGLC